MTEAAMNTDREIWREREGDYYADSIHVTKEGNIGIDCGGTVYVKPVRAWHALASAAPSPDPSEDEVEAVARAICALEHDPDGPTSDIYIPDDPDAIYVWAGFRPHARAAIAAMRPTLSEEDREEIAGLALSVKCLLEFEDFSDDRGERWKAYRVNAKTRAQTVLSLILAAPLKAEG